MRELHHDCMWFLSCLALRLGGSPLKPQDSTFMGKVWLLDSMTLDSPSYEARRNPTTVYRIENKDRNHDNTNQNQI